MEEPTERRSWNEIPAGAGYATNSAMPESTPVKRLYDGANLILLLLISYTIYSAYSKLPEHFPTHFNFAGQPDGFGGRASFVVLAAGAWLMTLLFYILIRYLPRMGRNPRSLNIPHKEEFLKLPEQKQLKYWALVAEFMAGILAGLNLLLYLLLRAITHIAMGEASLIPFTYVLAPGLIIVVLSILYLIRLLTLPGKLVRGEE